MPDVQLMTLAAAWLRPEPDASWSWDDAGEAISWTDGSTLTLRAELTQIVEHFIPNRLPPLGIIVLLLAALRGKVTQPPNLSSLSLLPPDLRTGLSAKLNVIDYCVEECTFIAPTEQAIAVLNLLKTDLPLRPVERKLSGPPQFSVFSTNFDSSYRENDR